MRERIAADSPKGRPKAHDPTFRGRTASDLRREFQLGPGFSGRTSRGRSGSGRLSDFGGGGGRE